MSREKEDFDPKEYEKFWSEYDSIKIEVEAEEAEEAEDIEPIDMDKFNVNLENIDEKDIPDDMIINVIVNKNNIFTEINQFYEYYDSLGHMIYVRYIELGEEAEEAEQESDDVMVQFFYLNSSNHGQYGDETNHLGYLKKFVKNCTYIGNNLNNSNNITDILNKREIEYTDEVIEPKESKESPKEEEQIDMDDFTKYLEDVDLSKLEDGLTFGDIDKPDKPDKPINDKLRKNDKTTEKYTLDNDTIGKYDKTTEKYTLDNDTIGKYDKTTENESRIQTIKA